MYNHLQQFFRLNYLLSICKLRNHRRIYRIHQRKYFYNHQILSLSKIRDNNWLYLDKKGFVQNNYYFLIHRKSHKHLSQAEFLSHYHERQEFLFQLTLP